MLSGRFGLWVLEQCLLSQQYERIYFSYAPRKYFSGIATSMEALTYTQSIVVIIFGAIGAVMLAYALWRLWASRQIGDSRDPHDYSPEQKEYMATVKDRNVQEMLAGHAFTR